MRIKYQILYKGGEVEEKGIKWDSGYDYISKISKLANNDITKFREVERTSFRKSMDLLALWKYQDDIRAKSDALRAAKRK